jgi:hypothetical protein
MKKKVIFILCVTFVVSLGFLITDNTINSQAQPKYVGVTSCVGACHKTESQGNQLGIWQNSQHSKAMQTLATPEADKIAKEKGFSTPAKETPECMKCHTLGKEVPAAPECESTFDINEGVQCETCHGPGSEYKKLSIMKDREKAVANGLIVHADVKAFCETCHNSQSPTFKAFDFATMWDKIKHPKP